MVVDTFARRRMTVSAGSRRLESRIPEPAPTRRGRTEPDAGPRRLGSLGRLMERFGLVGLPNAGKSSQYNALTGGGALAAPYPFATKDPNIGVAKVPDERLDKLSAMSKSKQTIHAAVEVVDIGGLVEGASKGEGLGNKFLANIREVDAIVFVLRAFENDDITGPSDPLTPACGGVGAGARRSRDRREAAPPDPTPGQAGKGPRRGGRRPPSRPRRARRGPPPLPGRPRRRREEAARPLLPAHQPPGAGDRQ